MFQYVRHDLLPPIDLNDLRPVRDITCIQVMCDVHMNALLHVARTNYDAVLTQERKAQDRKPTQQLQDSSAWPYSGSLEVFIRAVATKSNRLRIKIKEVSCKRQ